MFRAFIPDNIGAIFGVTGGFGEIAVFYKRDGEGLPRKWIEMMRRSIALIQNGFSTKRMLEDYLNKLLADIVQKNNLSNGDVFWPIRVALSGLETSPSPAELLFVLGKKESLKRIKKAINLLSNAK